MYTTSQLNSMSTTEILSIAENSIHDSKQVQDSVVYHLGELSVIENTCLTDDEARYKMMEVYAQIPNYDFLDEVIKSVKQISEGKMLKADMIKLADTLYDSLTEIKQDNHSRSEYAYDQLP